MMVNEETNDRPPNCQFLRNCVVATGDIAKDEELTIWYGDDYPRKKYGGYENNNPHRDEDLDDAFSSMALPDTNDVISKWLDTVDACFAKHPHEYAYKREIVDLTQPPRQVARKRGPRVYPLIPDIDIDRVVREVMAQAAAEQEFFHGSF
jgi:hypothetical protein